MQVIEITSHILAAESVFLSATLNAVDDDRFKCSKCAPRKRPGKFCDKKSENVVHKLGDLGFQKCPGNWFSFQILNYIEMHGLFEERGVMPFPGALADQPNKVIEIFRTISNHKAIVREKRMKEAELRRQHG